MTTSEQCPQILNLMQFARKAGQLVAGTDACLRAMHRKHIHLIVFASDSSERTIKRVNLEIKDSGAKLPVISFGSQAELSMALGLHKTGVFGISDKNFAAKIMEYWQA
ncbi:MAG: hypothetical protein PWP64_1063 [Candidatus Cloacimonadota bacterium]|nr:hypothetical protein [Candidatus Cloacimonadota bacterium]